MKTLQNLLILAPIVATAVFIGLGDSSFNCHNYAWEAERRWLPNPSAYVDAAVECEPKDATRIVYFDVEKPIHSGLYLGGGFVRSKWGSAPIVVHPVYLSIYGSNVRYYR